MRRALLAVAAAALAIAGAAGTGGLASVADGDAATHPTPPSVTPTPPVDARTPTDGMAMRTTPRENGSVVNPNRDRAPPGCDAIDGTREVTVRGGTGHAATGEAFGYDTERVRVQPCTRLVVTFVNEDAVRHQLMVHGLPTEIHPMGMFTLEVDGPGRVTGAFVTPARNYTLHTHCSLPQHTEKGMEMRVVVGDGSTGLVGAPGHRHDAAGHTPTAGGHSPSAGIGAPGFGPVVAVVAIAVAILVARER